MSSPSARPRWSIAPQRRRKRRSGAIPLCRAAERAAFLRSIAEEIDKLGDEITQDRCRRDRSAAGAAHRRARPHHRPAEAVRGPHREGRFSRPPPRCAAAGPAAAATPGHQIDPAADRPCRRVRRIELSARLLDGRRRHRLGARGRLSGGGERPFGASRHGRTGRPGDRRSDQETQAASRRVLADPGRQARCRRGVGAASADQGGGLHWFAGRRACAVRPVRGAAGADPVLRRAGFGQPDVRDAGCGARRAAKRSARAGPGR